ncbi:unnamed protein product, partial [Mesorhabditis spiculigera]
MEINWSGFTSTLSFYYNTYPSLNRDGGQGRKTNNGRAYLRERGKKIEFTLERCDAERGIAIFNQLLHRVKSGAIGLYVWPYQHVDLRSPVQRLALLSNPYSIVLKSCPYLVVCQLKWLKNNHFPLDNLAVVVSKLCVERGHHIEADGWPRELWRMLNLMGAAGPEKILFQWDGVYHAANALNSIQTFQRWARLHPLAPNKSRTIIVTFTLVLQKKADMKAMRDHLLRNMPKPSTDEIQIGLSVSTVCRNSPQHLDEHCVFRTSLDFC